MKMPSATIAVLAVLAACSAVAHAQLDLSQINVNELQQQLPAEFGKTNLTLEDTKALMKDKCVQVLGAEKGAEAYTAVEQATVTLGECVGAIVNYTAMQAEIEKAKPRGELDVVFNSYCKKRPQALECIETFNAQLMPCLEKDELDNQDVFMRIVRSLLNFVCHKGGDQIALFIAEQGPECLESKKEEIQQCLNDTFSGYMPKDGLDSVKTLPKFVMDQKQCDDMAKLEKCIVEQLETCTEITPANIVESMFRFIKNETICRTGTTAKQTGAAHAANSAPLLLSGAGAGHLAFSSLIAAIFYAVVKRFQLA